MKSSAFTCKLNALAWVCLSKLPGVPDGQVEVKADDGTTELVILARPAGHVQLEPDGIPSVFFSSLELQVVELLVGAGKMKQVMIGRKTGQTAGDGQANLFIRDVLRNLRERSVLDHDDDGFSLTPDALACAQKWGIAGQSRQDAGEHGE